jgi:hypothetical protein
MTGETIRALALVTGLAVLAIVAAVLIVERLP